MALTPNQPGATKKFPGFLIMHGFMAALCEERARTITATIFQALSWLRLIPKKAETNAHKDHEISDQCRHQMPFVGPPAERGFCRESQQP
jgi:hypothetical protein